MRALEIYVNGKKLCTAGIGDFGVLMATVRSDLRPARASKGGASPRIREQVGLDVGGLNTSSWEHLRWKTPSLRGGDEVLVKIIEAEVIDRPSRRERARTDEITRAEKKHVEQAAKRFGWKLEKPKAVRKPNPRRS